MSVRFANDPQASLGVLILSGGRSRRMGEDKARLPFRGMTMLEFLIRRFQPLTSSLVVVGPCAAEWQSQFPSVSFLQDEHPDRGPLEGMRVGFRFLQPRCQLVWVQPCDSPLVSLPLVQAMVDWAGDDEAVVASWDQRIWSLPALYRPGSAHERIEQLLQEGEGAVQQLAQRLKTKWVDETSVRSIDPQLISFFNVNTPEDYRRLLESPAG
jgi:molybdopterin-guanine dinucleotide biosynthesis protein A